MVDIRLATPDDAASLAELQLRTALAAYGAIFPVEAPPPTLDQLRNQWYEVLDLGRRPRAICLVAVDTGPPVGCVVARAYPGDAALGHLARLYVAPECWSRGIGSALYRAAIAALVAMGFTEATLWVLEHNLRARRWYERLGWLPTRERRPVYLPGRIDDVQYRRPLLA